MTISRYHAPGLAFGTTVPARAGAGNSRHGRRCRYSRRANEQRDQHEAEQQQRYPALGEGAVAPFWRKLGSARLRSSGIIPASIRGAAHGTRNEIDGA